MRDTRCPQPHRAKHWQQSCIYTGEGVDDQLFIADTNAYDLLGTIMNIKTIIAAACAVVASLSAANAGVIIAPTSATANVPTRAGDSSLEATINQSGLSAGYTSGVTDFDTYFAGNPTHNGAFAVNDWGSEQGTPQAEITYDLGGLYNLESFALWNRGLPDQGINSFELIFSETTDFAISTTVSGLNGGVAGANNAALADVFSFSVVSAAFVKLNILSTYNTFDLITFGEVAFESFVSEVPLPAALPLFLAGLAGLGFGRSKKARS